jgi:hypothetical protein
MKESSPRSSNRVCLPSARSLIAKGEPDSKTSQPKNKMASSKKKAKTKTAVKFRDLKSKRNPKGGASTGGGGGKSLQSVEFFKVI